MQGRRQRRRRQIAEINKEKKGALDNQEEKPQDDRKLPNRTGPTELDCIN